MSINATSNASSTTRWITRTALLLALTLAFQMIGLPQPITGPAVNAMLILSVLFAGPVSGVIIGSLTPLIAFQRGILAAPLGPMIPFIALANAVLVLLFALVRKQQPILAVVVAALAKFAVLATAVRLFVTVPPPIAVAMGTPQLLTALIGGGVALLAHRAIGQILKD
ncbi:MAG: ECF transporter S component [Bacillota bacterium]